MFRILGVLLAAYVAHSLVRGAVFARAGVWGRTYTRDEDAYHYWSTIICYVLLTLALLFVF